MGWNRRIGAFLAVWGVAAPLHGAPETYAGFVPVSSSRGLAKALERSNEIYLEPGTYVIDNPLVVDRDAPLYLHAGDRHHTQLVPRNPKAPLVVVERASVLGFANLSLRGKRPDARALLARNAEPFTLELLDANVQTGVVELAGPGSFRFQGVHFGPHGQTRSTLVVDHPSADAVVFGGNISNTAEPSAFAEEDPSQFHIWQKRGRLRVFSTGVQDTRGRADFRIDTRSALGPHAIVNVRSEGSNRTFDRRKQAFEPTLVYTPPSKEAVDLVLLSNGGAWRRGNRGQVIDYSAAGTVWLVGNNFQSSAHSLGVGSAPAATIVAVGNLSWHSEMFAMGGARIIAAHNIHQSGAADPRRPAQRFSRPGVKLASQGDVPPIPPTDLPPPLRRPRVTAPVGAMLDVTAPPFKAAGDGVKDDTRALQAALDAHCGRPHGSIVYFPAGTYRTTAPLEYNTKGRCFHPTGGWLAGAGKERTAIVRDPPIPGSNVSVFETDGAAYMTVQGIRFTTQAYDPSRPKLTKQAAVSLENVNGVGHATQEMLFYDVAFSGGRYGLGIGMHTPTQGSENLCVDCEFSDAALGLGIGSYNALANVVVDGVFRDNEVAMGHDFEAPALSGGTWAVYGAKIRGTRLRDQNYMNSASAAWYLFGLDSDSPAMTTGRMTSAAFPTVYERAYIHPAKPAEAVFNHASTGGPIFLHSRLETARIFLSGNRRIAQGLKRSNYALSLHSEVKDWKGAQTSGDFSQLDVLPVVDRAVLPGSAGEGGP